MNLKYYLKASRIPTRYPIEASFFDPGAVAAFPPRGRRALTPLFALLLVPALIATVLQLSSTPALAQDDLEDVLGEDPQKSEAEFMMDHLERLKSKPIDLNTATSEQLTEIPWISPLLAEKIVALRKKVGRFKSPVNLVVIEGVSYDLLEAISPYVTVTYKGVPYWIPTEGRVRATGDIPLHEANNLHTYGRVTSRPSEQVEISYLLEKDPGEGSVADFQAAYLSVARDGVLSRVNVGDLSAQFGQGLVLWAPGGYFRGYEAISQASRSAVGVRGYRSSFENGALRGAHVQLAESWLSLDALVSRAKLDATLNDDGTVARLEDSGIHVQERELEKKDALREDLFAVHAAARQSERLTLEATFTTSRYDPEFSSRGDSTSQNSDTLYFSGDGVSVGGLSARLALPQATVFGEAAMMTGGKKAFLLGWVSEVKKVQVATVFRDYQRDYYNLRASSFSGDHPWNERGLYLGLETRVAGSKVDLYADLIQHPGPGYREEFPKSGYEAAASVEQRYAGGVTTRLKWKVTKREDSETDPDDPYTKRSVTRSRQTYSGDVNWDTGRPLSLKLRYARVLADGGEKGSLVSTGFAYRTEGVVGVRGRVIYYDTSSYAARVYEYEDDLPGRVSFGPLSGEGMRWYVLLGVRGRKLGASAKFAQDRPADANGDGGPSSEFGLQLDFAF